MNTRNRIIVRSAACAGMALIGVFAGCSNTAEGMRADIQRNGDKLNDAMHGRPQGESAYERTYHQDPYSGPNSNYYPN